jgi:transposase-like protein
MSDRQKGLIKVVSKIFPDSEHRHCVRHLYQNFHKLRKGERLKNDLWAVARSSNIPMWEKNTEKMKTDSVAATEWIEELPPIHGSKLFLVIFLNVTCY